MTWRLDPDTLSRTSVKGTVRYLGLDAGTEPFEVVFEDGVVERMTFRQLNPLLQPLDGPKPRASRRRQ